MKKLILIPLLLTLSACANFSAAIDGLAQANDAALGAAELQICRGASVGSILRRYGQDPILARAWRDLCVERNGAVNDLIAPIGD